MRTKPRGVVLVLLVLAVAASFVATNATLREVAGCIARARRGSVKSPFWAGGQK